MTLNENACIIYDFLSNTPQLPEHADFILAAGAHDLRVADHAANLFLQGHAPLLVVSGGLGKVTAKLFQKPEGELFAERCIALGVPENAIVIENRSTNTGENFTFSRELLLNRKLKTGIIACKPYMAKRAWATGAKQWPEISWYASGIPLSFEEYPTETISREDTIQLMVGDLQRMWIYERKGFQVHVDVPDHVIRAWESLVEEGYNRYVIAE